MTDGYCAENLGRTITVQPGETLHSWGFFPMEHRPGERFSIRWWDWGETETDLRMP
ncbi:hypothetical protein [Catellatospora sp. NPDC049609]|uniref:hypothetical protein n=1 Tax=Catellatospora sp. NPDC049609 TaxID=3155505 RepID=UPI003426C90B